MNKEKLNRENKKDILIKTSKFVIAMAILISCYGNLMDLTIKTLRPNRKSIEKDDESFATVKRVSLVSLKDGKDDSISSANQSIINTAIEVNLPEIMQKVSWDIFVQSLNKDVMKDNFYDAELERKIDNKINLELIKAGIKQEMPSNDEKIAWILENYHLTMSEFKVIVAVVLAEAQGYSYEDAYAVINIIFNYTICERMVNSVNYAQGNGIGTSLYGQVIQRGHFSVYSNGAYKLYLNATPEEFPGMQAVIDFLYGSFSYDFENGEISWHGPALLHHFTEFRGCYTSVGNRAYVQYTSKGNKYIIPMKDNEYLSNLFTNISEQEVQEQAQQAEEFCSDYRGMLNSGISHEEALKLMRNR